MTNYNTAGWIGRQVAYKRQSDKAKKKELAEYDIRWECDRISEKGNKTLYYVALGLVIVPIVFIVIWWAYVTESGDLGTFFVGLGLLYILVPILIVGFGLIITYLIIRGSCRKRYEKPKID